MALVRIGKCHVVIGKCHVVIGKCHVVIGKCHIAIGECHVCITERHVLILAVITHHREQFIFYHKIALMKPTKGEKVQIMKLSVVVKVEVPTNWILFMVAEQKKDGSIRFCIDAKSVNKALKPNHYAHPDRSSTPLRKG